ncbi:uncharacterized protein RCC_01431 [Ramularia collo-cygni]|uniref:Uncharacterized protein n=1 Tax=Ramularia collo-cygni TaxID=112498 RepID=A0A2D3USF3_9PEZI|nr:uncharacterized protein RCC_01431 [Ramularia collo-cygni]CZT15580.1 uncharacterized protein RCC_01431 [Ramularia collo-cygni]
MAKQPQPAAKPSPSPCSAKGVDLNSLRATALPSIVFKPARKHDFPVVVLTARNPVAICIMIKQWLLDQLNPFLEKDDHLLRIEPLEVFQLEPRRTGSLILLEDAAHIEDAEHKGRSDGIPIAIFALLMPKDPRVRFFYIQGPITPLLNRLASELCISETARVIKPTPHLHDNVDATPDHHCRIYTWLQEAFLSAIAIPDHKDYANAVSMTDYAPFIKEGEDDLAMAKLQSCDVLYATKDEPTDLSDDRYVFALHKAERVLAAALGLRCGEYLLIKRHFFRAFKDDVLYNEKKLLKNAKVRTEYAHAQWLEKFYEWKLTRAKRLVAGWREVGFLEEDRIRAWIRSGGQFELGEHYDEE